MRHSRNDDAHRGEPRGRRWRRPWLLSAAALAAVALVAAACSGGASTTSSQSKARPTVHTGGTLTVLEGAALVGDWPEGLDPYTNFDTLLGNTPLEDAIFGELFQLGPGNTIIPDLATSYKLSDGNKTLTVDLRHGVTFSDGTAFNASAVKFNWARDLKEKTNPGNPPWPKTTITTPGPYTIVAHFASADGDALTQMLATTLSWIVSPTAVHKMGEAKFAFKPVGAGPFEVVSDTPSVKLVLKRNPRYWEAGRPYLNGLVFESVANDESALEDMRAHVGQAYQGMATPELVSSFKSAGFTVTNDPGSGVVDIELGDTNAPMTSLKAREAVYYAIDAAAISKSVYDGTCVVDQSFTGPGGLFYDPKVPDYRSYDLSKAKSLVHQLGGLTFTMYYLDTPLDSEEAEALHTMFADAGMNVTITPMSTLSAAVAEFDTHKWQSIFWVLGSWDPGGGTGVAFFLASDGPFTGIHNSTVDYYINLGVTTSNQALRKAAYDELAKYLSQDALVPFICSAAGWDIAAKGVRGPGLTSAYGDFVGGPLVEWQNVSMDNG